MNKIIKIYNGLILTPYRIIHGTVVVDNFKIIDVVQGNVEISGATEIDANGNYISPGFIDIHVHGGGGHDFMDGTEEAFLGVAQTHAKFGTTALLPTTLTSEIDELYNTSGSQFLGIHLEGPYFAVSQKGAQDPRHIRNPDPKEYMEILSRSADIARWSAAPELPGAIEFGRVLRSRGILVSMGHTDAIYEDALAAFKSGYTLATHFYSCMSSVTRRNCLRYAGVIEAAYLLDEMYVEIIADGIHLPEALLKLIYKIKGSDRIALVTDAIRAAGTDDKETILGSNNGNGLRVIVEDGVAKLVDRSSFAGSVATSDRLVRNMVNVADVPLLEAVKMASQTPANILGLGASKGSLTAGKDADIVIFDNNINVSTTIVQGRVVFQCL